MTKEPNRHFLALVPFTVILAVNLLSCSPNRNLEEDFRQEVATLERKTTPPEAKVLTRSGPGRSDWSVTASWDIETTMGKTDYSNWVISKLKPEFKVEREDDSRLALSKREDNDIHSIDCQFIPAKEKLGVHVAFSARPD